MNEDLSEDELQEYRKENISILFIVGLVFTIAYLVAIFGLRANDFLCLLRFGDLNNLGDFLAGVFAPLAFLWLVLGYLQQQKELKQNTKALLLQHRELSRSVYQREELKEMEREALYSSMENETPQDKCFFDIQSIKETALDKGIRYSILILNKGVSLDNVEINMWSIHSKNVLGQKLLQKFRTGENIELHFEYSHLNEPLEELDIYVRGQSRVRTHLANLGVKKKENGQYEYAYRDGD